MSKTALLVPMRFHFCISFLLTFFLAMPGYSTRHYVGSPGADTPGGGGAFNPFETVAFAISQAANGDSIVVLPGTYSETNISITKEVKIFGNETGGVPGVGTKPVFNGTGATANSSIFHVKARNILIQNFELRVDQANVTRGIYGDKNARFNGLVISDNDILSTSTGTASTFNSWGIALGINISTPALADSSLILRNFIGPAPGARLFGRAIRISGGFSTIGGTDLQDGNTLTGTYGIQCGDAAGTMRILKNTIFGTSAAIEMNSMAFSADHLIEGNTISPVPNVAGGVCMIEVKNNNRVGSNLHIRANNISGFPIVGIFSTKSKNVFVENNVFTPADTARNFISISVNTKQQTTSQSELPSASSISITGNTFNAASGVGGTAISFQNHFSGVNPPFQNVVIGGNGNSANTFGLLLSKVFDLDARTGPSNLVPIWNQTNYKITQMLPVEADFDLSKNRFEFGTGPKLPSELSTAELFFLEDRIQHQVDFDSLGFVTVVPQNAFVTSASSLPPKTISPSLNRAVDAVNSDGWTITAASGAYAEDILVDSSITLKSDNSAEISISSLTMNGNGKSFSLGSDLQISSSLTLSAGNIKTSNSILTLANGATLNGGSSSSYIETNGSGSFIRKGVDATAAVYPIGISTAYSPTTLINTGTSDDIGLRVQPDVLDGGLTGSPVDSVVGITWVANEGTPGGSSLNITAQWPGSAEKTGFNRTATRFQGFAGSEWLTLSGDNTISASGSDPFSATFTGISGDLVNLPLRIGSISGNPPASDKSLFFVSDLSGNDSRTAEEASNPATPWKTIGKALASVSDGDSVQVLFGVYRESNLSINKSVKLFGNVAGIGPGNGLVRPVISGNSVGSDSALLVISSPDVRIEHFELQVKQDTVKHGIYAPNGNYNNLQVLDCEIYSTAVNPPGNPPCNRFNSYGMRFLDGNGDSVIVKGTVIAPKDFPNTCTFGRGIRMFRGGRLIAGGPLASDRDSIIALYGVQIGDADGPCRIENNRFFGQGVEITAPKANSGTHIIRNNQIDAALPQFFTYLVEIKDVQNSGTSVLVEGNRIFRHRNIGLSSARSKNIIIRNNIFEPSPAPGDTAFVHLYVNTKQATRSDVQNPALNEITIQGNQFKGRTSSNGGTAVLFANHNDDPNADNAFGSVTVGGDAADANIFAGNLHRFVRLDANSGPSNVLDIWQLLPVTTMAPVKDNFDFGKNLFSVSGTDKRPADMNLDELFLLEDRIDHGIDAAVLGFVKVKDSSAFVTPNSFLSPLSSIASLQRAVGKAQDNWTINIQNSSINEVVAVDKNLNWNTHPADSMVLSGIAMRGQNVLLQLQDNFYLADSLKLDAVNGGKIKIGSHNLVLLNGAKAVGGSEGSYVITDGNGDLIIRNVSAEPVTFPVGTVGSFAPLTFDDENPTGDNFRVRVAPAATGADFTPALPASINSFVKFQWTICEKTPGGSNAKLSFDWLNSSNIEGSETLNSVLRNDGSNWLSSSALIGPGQTAVAQGISQFCAPFAVVAFADIQITTGNPLDRSLNQDLQVCPGDTILVPFTANGPFASGNEFVLVLSDASGSFTNADTISILPLSGTSSDTISGIIPAGAAPGLNYRVRVLASIPVTAGSVNSDDIKVNGLPAVPVITGPASFCIGDSVRLISSVAEGIVWAPGGETNDTITVKAGGSYSVKVTDQAGCSAVSLPLNVQANPLPVPVISPLSNSSICQFDTLRYSTTQSFASYKWLKTGLADTTSAAIKISSPGTYPVSVIVTDANGCSDTSAVVSGAINLLPVPVITPLVNSSVCQFDTLRYSTTQPFAGYKWLKTGLADTTSATIKISAPGTYTVSVIATDANGCSDTSAVVNGQVNPKPVPEATTGSPANFTACQGDTIVLTANPVSFRYRWLEGGPNDTLRTLKVLNNGSFRVELSTAFGCKDTAVVVNTVINSLPVPVINPLAASSVCQFDTLRYSTTQSFVGYKWLKTGLTDSTAAIIKISAPGTYPVSVIATDANGCSDTSAVVIGQVNPKPVAEATTGNPSNLTACQGDTIILTASPVSFKYRWLEGGPADTLRTLKVVSAGTFRVEIATAFGCKDTSDAVVTVINSLPVPVINPLTATSVCQFDTLRYSTTESFAGYKWLKTGLTDSTTATVKISAPGTYPVSVLVTDGNGCRNTSAVVTGQINPKPVAEATTGNPANFTACQGDTIVLTANPASARYRWLDAGPNDTLRNFKVIAAGTFRVELSTAFGCKDTSEVVTTIINPLPFPVITSSEADNRICSGDTIVLTSNYDEGNSWFGAPGNPKTKSIRISVPIDAIRLTVIDANGCSKTTDPVQVIVDPLPVVTIRKDSAYASGDEILLEAVNFSVNVSSFEWYRAGESFANTGPSPSTFATASSTAFYSVVITDQNGCKQKDSLLIRVSEKVFVPNSFSPNGDFNNDYFMVYGFGVKEILFQVWDRLGNVVYESSNPDDCVETGLSPNKSQKGWDGKYKGDLLPPGSYIWTVKGKLNTGEDINVEGGKLNGSVLLLN